MQIWIYFQPGVGGDGIANLLEKSTTVCTLDLHSLEWRLHRYVDGQPKFWAPVIDQLHCFRRDIPFKLINNKLSQRYIDLVENKQLTVVTSHDVLLKNLNNSDEQHILKRDQIKVLITTRDLRKAMLTNLNKTIETITPEKLDHTYDWHIQRYSKLDHGCFDIVVHAEDIRQDWTAMSKLCEKLSLTLDKQHFTNYIDILSGKNKNLEIDQYMSTITSNGSVKYVKMLNN